MYNIKQAAARAGVTVPVLRAWERRYGIVDRRAPPAGYRQFDERASPASARCARSSTKAGRRERRPPRSSTASVPVRGQARRRRAGGAGRAGRRRAAVADRTRRVAASSAERFVAAAQALDTDGDRRRCSTTSSRAAPSSASQPTSSSPPCERARRRVGGGPGTVAGEHMASSAVHRRLGLALEAAGRAEAAARRVVVGLPPGGRHELGALAFAVAARRAGLPVTYLGADLPMDDWVTAAAGARPPSIGVVDGPRPERGPRGRAAAAARPTRTSSWPSAAGRRRRRPGSFACRLRADRVGRGAPLGDRGADATAELGAQRAPGAAIRSARTTPPVPNDAKERLRCGCRTRSRSSPAARAAWAAWRRGCSPPRARRSSSPT